jgi:hypothetical protein
MYVCLSTTSFRSQSSPGSGFQFSVSIRICAAGFHRRSELQKPFWLMQIPILDYTLTKLSQMTDLILVRCLHEFSSCIVLPWLSMMSSSSPLRCGKQQPSWSRNHPSCCLLHAKVGLEYQFPSPRPRLLQTMGSLVLVECSGFEDLLRYGGMLIDLGGRWWLLDVLNLVRWGKTSYSPIFSCLSFFEASSVFESLICIPFRNDDPTRDSKSSTVMISCVCPSQTEEETLWLTRCAARYII